MIKTQFLFKMAPSRMLMLHIALWLSIGSAFSQPFTLDKNIKPLKLQLKKVEDHAGAKATAAKGTLQEDPHLYFVKGSSMFQPIELFLAAEDESELIVELVKNTWEEVLKSTSTAAFKDGIANLKIRTYGDFGIRVKAKNNANISSGIPYVLTIYALPEQKKFLPSPFVSKSSSGTSANKEKEKSSRDYDKNKKESSSPEENHSSPLLLILLGAAVLIIVGLFVYIIKNKKNRLNSWIIIATGIGFVAGLWSDPSYAQAGRRNSIFQVEIDLNEIKDAIDGEKAKELADKIKDLKEAMTSTKDLLENYFGLGDCLQMPYPPGMPAIPSFCAEEEEGALGNVQEGTMDCARCFQEARDEFNQVRYNLEQLRIIFGCTMSFSKKAISFGDNTSGVHGVSGMAWQVQRAKIEASVDQMKKAYDQKYEELIQKLQKAMMELAICEEEFGTPDWYDRFGYMYMEFVEMAYRRKEE